MISLEFLFCVFRVWDGGFCCGLKVKQLSGEGWLDGWEVDMIGGGTEVGAGLEIGEQLTGEILNGIGLSCYP